MHVNLANIQCPFEICRGRRMRSSQEWKAHMMSNHHQPSEYLTIESVLGGGILKKSMRLNMEKNADILASSIIHDTINEINMFNMINGVMYTFMKCALNNIMINYIFLFFSVQALESHCVCLWLNPTMKVSLKREKSSISQY